MSSGFLFWNEFPTSVHILRIWRYFQVFFSMERKTIQNAMENGKLSSSDNHPLFLPFCYVSFFRQFDRFTLKSRGWRRQADALRILQWHSISFCLRRVIQNVLKASIEGEPGGVMLIHIYKWLKGISSLWSWGINHFHLEWAARSTL